MNATTGYQLQVMNSPFGDCTNHGASSGQPWVNVVGRINGTTVEPIDDHLCRYGTRDAPLFAVDTVGKVDCLVPVGIRDGQFVAHTGPRLIGPMSGGNVAIVTPLADEQFAEWLTGKQPSRTHGLFLSIHDRFETPETYLALSE